MCVFLPQKKKIGGREVKESNFHNRVIFIFITILKVNVPTLWKGKLRSEAKIHQGMRERAGRGLVCRPVKPLPCLHPAPTSPEDGEHGLREGGPRVGVGRGPEAGLVPELEANVGATSGGEQLGRPSVTISELDPSSPSPHFPDKETEDLCYPRAPRPPGLRTAVGRRMAEAGLREKRRGRLNSSYPSPSPPHPSQNHPPPPGWAWSPDLQVGVTQAGGLPWWPWSLGHNSSGLLSCDVRALPSSHICLKRSPILNSFSPHPVPSPPKRMSFYNLCQQLISISQQLFLLVSITSSSTTRTRSPNRLP